MYIDHLVEPYLLINGACHTSDLELFTFCLRKLYAVSFATSCPNFARWMTRYHLDILYIDEAHPAAGAALETGTLLSTRRTIKPFFGSPVDLTLEQMLHSDEWG